MNDLHLEEYPKNLGKFIVDRMVLIIKDINPQHPYVYHDIPYASNFLINLMLFRASERKNEISGFVLRSLFEGDDLEKIEIYWTEVKSKSPDGGQTSSKN